MLAVCAFFIYAGTVLLGSFSFLCMKKRKGMKEKEIKVLEEKLVSLIKTEEQLLKREKQIA